jgi:hypothetical protein
MSRRSLVSTFATLPAAALLAASLSAFAPAAATAQPAATPEMRAAFWDAAAACSADRYRFCGGVAAGGGRIARCLAANEDRLTRDCRIAMHEAWRTYTAESHHGEARYGDFK